MDRIRADSSITSWLEHDHEGTEALRAEGPSDGGAAGWIPPPIPYTYTPPRARTA